MKFRKITSLTSLLCFIPILITSVILYIAPQGRVAYWSDWRLLGLDKEEWGAIHINTGFLFLLALILHIYYNIKPIINYLKNKTKQLKVFTSDFNIALAVVLVVVLATFFKIPPIYTVIEIGNSIKDTAAREYGEPPYGHAELSSLKTFAQKMGLNLEEALKRLHDANYVVDDANLSLKEIAANNNISPQQLYMTMDPTASISAVFSGQAKDMPASPPSGVGSLPLVDLCAGYNLNMKTVIRRLADAGIAAEAEQSIKDIAEQNDKSPMDIYDLIRDIAVNAKEIDASGDL